MKTRHLPAGFLLDPDAVLCLACLPVLAGKSSAQMFGAVPGTIFTSRPKFFTALSTIHPPTEKGVHPPSPASLERLERLETRARCRYPTPRLKHSGQPLHGCLLPISR
jgi:hypothetical protein